MDYRQKIVEWFHLNSPITLNHGGFGHLQKQLRKLEMMYPIKAIYFSLQDVEKNDLDWINKKDFINVFGYIKYVFIVANKYFQDNAVRVDREDKQNNEVEHNVELIDKNDDRVLKRKVKDISDFL